MILTGQETLTIQMALQTMIDDMTSMATNTNVPFTPSARKDMRDILNNATSALKKIEKLQGREFKMEEYKDGDEKEFMTKES